MPGNGIGPAHAHTAARENPASNPTPESSEPRCTANEEEKAQLKTSAAAICNLIIDFFDADINEAKVERE